VFLSLPIMHFWHHVRVDNLIINDAKKCQQGETEGRDGPEREGHRDGGSTATAATSLRRARWGEVPWQAMASYL
jgi:hypothetical protein